MIRAEEVIFEFLQRYADREKDVVLTNYFHGDWEADILLIKDGHHSIEFEIKLSKADFKNDFKKKYRHHQTGEEFLKHDKICCGDYPCNYFYFLLPMGMVSHSDIPDHCGIIEFYHNPDAFHTTFEVVRQARQLHETPFFHLFDKDLMLRRLALSLLYKKFEKIGREEDVIFKSRIGGNL